MNLWKCMWKSPDSRVADATLSVMMAGYEYHDFVETDKPLVVKAYPGIISGASRLVEPGRAVGSGTLYPCAHAIQIRAGSTDVINETIHRGLPIRCPRCVEEAQ